MMDPVRSAGIWLGVGAGHVAVVAAVWLGGSGAPATEGRDAGLMTLVLLAPSEPLPAEPAAVPLAHSAEPVAVPSRRPRVSAPVPVAAAVPAAPVPAAPVAAAGVVGEPPGFVDRVEPSYPRGARLAGVEGVVRLRLQIGADGALRQVSRVSGSGDAALDRAAEAAARASTYRPARVGDRPVEAEVEASYRFELR